VLSDKILEFYKNISSFWPEEDCMMRRKSLIPLHKMWKWQFFIAVFEGEEDLM
jgi:hypothetical protein